MCKYYLRGIHNEIHNIAKTVKPKYFKWLLKVIKAKVVGKGHILLIDQTTDNTSERLHGK